MAETLPSLLIDPESLPARLAGLFTGSPERIVMEIGFGGGEHLVAAAQRSPETGFIGVEPFVAGLGRAVSEIDRLKLTNLRLYDDDAGLLLEKMPAGSLDRVELPYPDPWPKKRHHKRRFIGPQNLTRIARVLRPGGTFLVATDIADYARWTLLHTRECPEMIWTAEAPEDWRQAPEGWTPTRYESKARAAGRVPVYLTFVRR